MEERGREIQEEGESCRDNEAKGEVSGCVLHSGCHLAITGRQSARRDEGTAPGPSLPGGAKRERTLWAIFFMGPVIFFSP